MRLQDERKAIDTPEHIQKALFTITHWMNGNQSPDLTTDITITEKLSLIGQRHERVRYAIEIKEIGRQPWPIEGEVIRHGTNP